MAFCLPPVSPNPATPSVLYNSSRLPPTLPPVLPPYLLFVDEKRCLFSFPEYCAREGPRFFLKLLEAIDWGTLQAKVSELLLVLLCLHYR